MQLLRADYFAAYRNLKLSRDDKGVLVAEFHSNGGPFIMTAQSHTEFVDAFYRIGQDRANKIVILTGAGGEFITDVAWSSFGDVADPGVWSQVHDEGVQVLENIANIRVPVIAAIEGRAHVHSDYALLASVIVAAEGATFQDVAHFAAGVAPGDGIFTTWSYRAGAGRAEAFLLNPQPLPARTAQDHTEFVDAFYRIAQDRANKIVILTGAGGDFIPEIDFPSFGNVADPGVWSQVHDEGVQIVENIANIRVPVIAAIEGRAHVHSEYALLASVIVAAEGATFHDVAHFAGGIVPGDGIFTTWSYRAGAGRAEAFLLNPQPLTARTAHEWGVIAEVVPNGEALGRARELAELYLKAPEVTRRNTRVHFIQPLKERIVREVGYGLSLEGASAADLVKVMK